LEKEGPVINFIGFYQGDEESIKLRCSNNPIPGGRAAPKERIRGEVYTTILEKERLTSSYVLVRQECPTIGEE
jgi:hypothetical protein